MTTPGKNQATALQWKISSSKSSPVQTNVIDYYGRPNDVVDLPVGKYTFTYIKRKSSCQFTVEILGMYFRNVLE